MQHASSHADHPGSAASPQSPTDSEAHQMFSADIASLHASSLNASRMVYHNTLPAKTTDVRSGSSDHLENAMIIFLQLGYTLLAYAQFLATTWFRVLIILPNSLFQPLTVGSMVLFATLSSALLLPALLLSAIRLLPIVGDRLQSAIDYLVLGPFVNRDATTARYYRLFPRELKEGALKALSAPLESDFHTKDELQKPRVIDLNIFHGSELAHLLAKCRHLCNKASKASRPAKLRKPLDRQSGTSAQNGGDFLQRGQAQCSDCDHVIKIIADQHLQLQYEALCDLPSRHSSPQRPSTASVGLFYSLDTPTFIILSFKGTTPTSFPDWLVDFSYPYLPANAELNGYGSVHEGFYRALFPLDLRGYSQCEANGPWDVIRRGIRRTITHLDHLQPVDAKRDINVWVTGHSLGAALAQVFFAKAMQSENEWKVKIQVGREEEEGDISSETGRQAEKEPRYATGILRDSYTFGTPVISDVFSRGAFNNALFSPEKRRRHDVWRFVNHDDIVATGLPDLGDASYKPGWFSAALSTVSESGGLGGLNAFTFTHVGQEVILADGTDSRVGPGTLWPWGTKIVLKQSAATWAKGTNRLAADGVRPYLSSMPRWLIWLQHFPLLGRFVAHSPILYAYQLEKCEASTSAEGQGQALAWAV